MTLGPHGFTTTLNYTTSLGESKSIRINDRDIMCMALELIERNLSTGIGKALHIKHLLDVCDGRVVSQQTTLNNGMPVMKEERLPGMLSKNPVYREWYHRHVKGQNLCVQILGRQIAADDHITPVEEKKLWDYYQSNPSYNGFKGMSPETELKKIKDKIESAKPKALKNNQDSWREQLIKLKKSLPISSTEIQKLIALLG